MRTPRLLPLLALALVLAACRGDQPASRGGSAGQPSDGGMLVIATPGEPDLLFPALAQTQQGRHLTDLLFDRLAEIGDDLNSVGDAGFTPRLARQWTWAKDSLSVAFALDPRARWHDGRPVRAEDVRFSVDVTRDPKTGSPIAQAIGNVDSVQVRDSLTAVVWFKRHTPEQFYDFVYQVPIVPAHVYGAVPRDRLREAPVMRQPVGSGRFRFARWEPQRRVELIADTANYRGRPRLDRIVYTVVTDFDAGLTQLLSGQADMWENLLPDHLPRLKGNDSVRVLRYPSMQFAFLAFNFRDPKAKTRPHPIFADRAVRRALSMAVDRRAMVANVFDSLGILSYGPFPRSHVTADTTLRLPPFDVAAARQLLDSAGWRMGPDSVRAKDGRPLAFSIVVPTSSKARMSYAVLLEQAFRSVGARVTLDQLDVQTFVSRMNGGAYDALLQGVGVDPNVGAMRQYWGRETAGVPGGNTWSYVNPAFDAAMDSAVAQFDPAKARRYTSRAYQVLAEDAPAVWLYDVLTMGAVHDRMQVPRLRADGWWSSLPDWWIPEGRRIPRDRVGLRAATAP